MKKIVERHHKKQSFFYCLANKSLLATQFGLPQNFFRSKYKEQLIYSFFEISKKDGSSREINNPKYDLKVLQRKILNYMNRIYKPDWLMSGRKTISYIDNGRKHLGSNYVITIDIKKIYSNCKRNNVYNMFKDVFKMTPDIASIMADLTTFEGAVPTGAPTSQVIAFWTYQDAFEKINEIAQQYDCIFSLYVDDMTFSSLGEIPTQLLLEVDKELKLVGLSIKWKKVKRFGINHCKLITGVVLDEAKQMRIPNALRLSIIQGVKKLSNKELSQEERLRLIKSLKGKINSARNIEPEIFPEIHRKISSI
ncbi:reverse transcriptase family protein [Pelosinus propionicus]|uniref:Reverse transcriptase (RNA-dependent DNA polymerase) n=1 Tax=Pelosinus propionicus DSM 13327 TaxID=1123291 RepID=A0A1I4Q3I9_9FIRM|nr:reverse transcriptase family protein [Pelosinus propionicus]SFM34658.1 Reverse transcriptase (RNA-dependent DNA polymerase) [Pelosinus propionicus DSM 13327]